MPNWCHSDLTVSGPRASHEEFRIRSKGGEFEPPWTHLVPIPNELRDQAERTGDVVLGEERERKYGASSWPDWVGINWGAKWDVVSDYPEPPTCIEQDATLLYSFYTAYGPNEEWLKRVASMFPDLTFVLEYQEDGGFTAGEITAHGNEYREKELPYVSWDTEDDDDEAQDGQ